MAIERQRRRSTLSRMDDALLVVVGIVVVMAVLSVVGLIVHAVLFFVKVAVAAVLFGLIVRFMAGRRS
jgi:Flp pilus assembly protein TadB